MKRRRSILDLKHLVEPLPHVATRPYGGRWQAAILFPKAVEPLNFSRPTERGLENEIIHQCRKHGHKGYQLWESVQSAWDETRGKIICVYGYQSKTSFTGACWICGKHIGMGTTVRWNKIKSDNGTWRTDSIQCLRHKIDPT